MIGQTISYYRITEELGGGGMGVAYKAEGTTLKRPVALKFLAAHLLKDEEARKRFHREAQAAAALHHPNVCLVYGIGEEEDQTFLAMACIEGQSLDKRMEQGPLKIPEALDIAQQIAKGLEAAHEKGVVHRDIKPGNILVTLLIFTFVRGAASMKLASNAADRVITNDSSPQVRLQAGGPRGLA